MEVPKIFSRREPNFEEQPEELKDEFTRDWSISVTGRFSKRELEGLRDDYKDEIAQFFYSVREVDNLLSIEAVWEIYAHGNEQKAALVARAIVKKIPDFVEDIETFFGEKIATDLLEGKILKMKR